MPAGEPGGATGAGPLPRLRVAASDVIRTRGSWENPLSCWKRGGSVLRHMEGPRRPCAMSAKSRETSHLTHWPGLNAKRRRSVCLLRPGWRFDFTYVKAQRRRAARSRARILSRPARRLLQNDQNVENRPNSHMGLPCARAILSRCIVTETEHSHIDAVMWAIVSLSRFSGLFRDFT